MDNNDLTIWFDHIENSQDKMGSIANFLAILENRFYGYDEDLDFKIGDVSFTVSSYLAILSELRDGCKNIINLLKVFLEAGSYDEAKFFVYLYGQRQTEIQNLRRYYDDQIPTTFDY